MGKLVNQLNSAKPVLQKINTTPISFEQAQNTDSILSIIFFLTDISLKIDML